MPIDPENLEAISPEGSRYPIKGLDFRPMALFGVDIYGSDVKPIAEVDLIKRFTPGPLEQISPSIHAPQAPRPEDKQVFTG